MNTILIWLMIACPDSKPCMEIRFATQHACETASKSLTNASKGAHHSFPYISAICVPMEVLK